MLVDSNVVLRTLQPADPLYPQITDAIRYLRRAITLYIVPQNLVEFWVVATRPPERNGLGLFTRDAALQVAELIAMFRLLPETDQIYPEWQRLVVDHQVSGKPAHDARLVAAMKVHGIESILTFDRTGFSRYPGIRAVSPADIQPQI